MDARKSPREAETMTGRRHPGRPVFALLLLALPGLSGCAYFGDWLHNGFKVGPDYHGPAAPVAKEWIDFNNPRLISQACGVDEAAWWCNFGDPVMNELVLAAYRQNLPLRVAGLRVLEAEAQRAIAVGGLFPQSQDVFGNFEQRQRSLNGFTNGLPPGDRSLGVWTTGFNASWELDVWGRFRRAIESADANLDSLVFNYDDVLVTLIGDTASAYIEVRAFQERLRYERANIATQEKSLQLAEDRFGTGIATKLDVTEAQSTLHQTRTLAPVLERGLRAANNRLCVLLGIPPCNLVAELGNTGEEALPRPPEQVVVGIPADLIRRRPDVRRAEREVATQSALIGVAAADLFPMFTINGSINWQASNFADLFTPDSTAGFIRPGFDWKILNYGRIVNNVKVQDARFQQFVVTYLQTVLNANRDVEDGINEFLRSSERAAELAETVKAAAESVTLAQVQYQQGWIDFDRVNNLQRDLAAQEDAWAAARADVAFGLIHIYRALGGGWQLRCPGTPAAPAPLAAASPNPQAGNDAPVAPRPSGGPEENGPSDSIPLARK
jgi:NodT family efflux transporter outer membrane factor (OMF) lipoprotein